MNRLLRRASIKCQNFVFYVLNPDVYFQDRLDNAADLLGKVVFVA